jgi:hypothetical protein
MKQDEIRIEIHDLIDWEIPKNSRMIELLIKKSGIWKFNKYDKDSFPSTPHGHNVETGEKLDVYTGIAYDPTTKQLKRKLAKRKLKEIQQILKINGFALSPTP